ncbi:hypothetical protein NC653_040515 [Populus alba x Populus x berolinensis]|uniref:Uncharacterized protein n=1 Tax=Populus alba x Populus x berolinensis TaxID=444605 RepID=A0AAD6PN73_9ROSI|nr:hypothetical protein NC653_040515 [Populus alba x Populus x berolinensis]
MTVTDEPGCYEDGNFGIRLENVLIVKEADTKFNFGDKGYLSFEHKTWAPYQTKMIDLTLLGPEKWFLIALYFVLIAENPGSERRSGTGVRPLSMFSQLETL